MLPSNQRPIIKQGNFTYSPLRKAFGKQTKTIEEQGEKNKQMLLQIKTKVLQIKTKLVALIMKIIMIKKYLKNY